MIEVTPDHLAGVFDEVALLLELQGATPVKVRAYRQGAQVVRESDANNLVQRARDGELEGIAAIGDEQQKHLRELAQTGCLEFHQKLRAEFPEGLFEVLELPDLDPRQVRILYHDLGIESPGALREACESGKADALPGIGKKVAQGILAALDNRERAQMAGRFRRAEVVPVAERIAGMLRSHPDVIHAEVVGTYRREEPAIDDLHFLVATKKPTVLTEFFTELEEVHQVILQGSSTAAVRLQGGMKCDLRAVAPAEWPFALLHFTGSKEHVLELRARALKQGLVLNEFHLALAQGETWNDSAATIEEESDIYRELGLSYLEPKLRDGCSALKCAGKGERPSSKRKSPPKKRPASESPGARAARC